MTGKKGKRKGEEKDLLLDKFDRQETKSHKKMRDIIESTEETMHHIKESADSLMEDVRINLDSSRKFHHNELEDD